MKKIISLMLCGVLIFSCFVGCSKTSNKITEENITNTVEIVGEALRTFNTDDLSTYVSSSTLSVIMGYAEEHQQFADLGKAIFENLEMEVKSVDVDNATVTVEVKNKDLYNVASNFAQNLKENYSTFQLLTKLSNDTFLDANLNTLCEDINNADFLDEATEVTLSVKADDKNLVLTFDDSAEDAVSGGALSAIKGIYS